MMHHPFSTRSAVRRIAGALTAAALTLGAIAATSAPARATSDLDALFLALTAGVAGFSQTVHARPVPAQPDKPLPIHDRRPQPAQPGWQGGNPGWQHGHPGWSPPQYHRPVPQPVRPLPGVCAIRIEGVRDSFFPRRCLREYGLRAELPNRCARELRTYRGPRTVYSGDCLRQAGFGQQPHPALIPHYPTWRHPQDAGR